MTEDKEKIGFHKGALATLAKEREEVVKMLQIVEALIQAHVKELENLGVDLKKEAEKYKKELEKRKKAKLDERI